jgi:hypothetical protein
LRSPIDLRTELEKVAVTEEEVEETAASVATAAVAASV